MERPQHTGQHDSVSRSDSQSDVLERIAHAEVLKHGINPDLMDAPTAYVIEVLREQQARADAARGETIKILRDIRKSLREMNGENADGSGPKGLGARVKEKPAQYGAAGGAVTIVLGAAVALLQQFFGGGF